MSFSKMRIIILYSLTFGNDALRKFTSFKKFIVEETGVNKDKFDIKTRALMPLIDGARLP
jgi:CBS domain-containing protein